MTRFVVVPQWQGSASTRAMQLIDGAEAVAGDLPRTATTVLNVPLEAGDALGTRVRRLSSLQRVRALLDETLSGSGEPVLVVGGDTSVTVGAVAHAAAHTERLAVVWADAHPALHTPDSSTAQAFADMALRAILGEGPESLRLTPGTVAPRDVVLVGARTIDEPEAQFLAETGMSTIAADALADPDALADAVAALGATAAYVHVDVDVLAPDEMPGVKPPEPFGARLDELVAALKTLRSRVPIAGASLTEFLPASPAAAAGDLGTMLRLIGALA